MIISREPFTGARFRQGIHRSVWDIQVSLASHLAPTAHAGPKTFRFNPPSYPALRLMDPVKDNGLRHKESIIIKLISSGQEAVCPFMFERHSASLMEAWQANAASRTTRIESAHFNVPDESAP